MEHSPVVVAPRETFRLLEFLHDLSVFEKVHELPVGRYSKLDLEEPQIRLVDILVPVILFGICNYFLGLRDEPRT